MKYLLLSLLLSACGTNVPDPVPLPTPSPVPVTTWTLEVSGDNVSFSYSLLSDTQSGAGPQAIAPGTSPTFTVTGSALNGGVNRHNTTADVLIIKVYKDSVLQGAPYMLYSAGDYYNFNY